MEHGNQTLRQEQKLFSQSLAFGLCFLGLGCGGGALTEDELAALAAKALAEYQPQQGASALLSDFTTTSLDGGESIYDVSYRTDEADTDLPILDVTHEGASASATGDFDYIVLDDDDRLDLSDRGSVEAWFTADAHRAWAGVVHKGELPDFSDEAYSLQFWGSTGRMAVFLKHDAGGSSTLQGTTVIAPGALTHAVLVFDENEINLFINGVLDATLAHAKGPVRNSDGGLVVGAQLSSDYNGSLQNLPLDGIVHEARVYDRALSDAEVTALFDAGV